MTSSDHGWVVHKIGLFEKLLSFIAHKTALSLLVTLVLLGSTNFISIDKQSQFLGETFNIQFSNFSPAFAAFEDDFLFPEVEASTLKPGESQKVFQEAFNPPPVRKTLVKKQLAQKSSAESAYLQNFDGSINLGQFRKSLAKAKSTYPRTHKTNGKKELMANEELPLGPLVAMVAPVTGSNPRTARPSFSHSNKKPVTKKPQKPTQPDFVTNSSDNGNKIKYDTFQISGNIQLKEGLAFVGSMEVSWVVGDHELQVGSINVPDATYEIEVNKPIGDIIISLYDRKDELIGEGIYDLTQINTNQQDHQVTIEIHPIDWDLAGHIIDGNSLGSGVKKPLDQVEVALYSFNDATKTTSTGAFSFYNWKKSNSRTLAIASKKGFRDSVFMLDSKQTSEVLLFTEKYIDSFFLYLNELGVYEVSERATVYGKITGVSDSSGYQVSIDKNKPIYFLDAGFATLEQNSTSNNGQFAFVGLQDGDYDLIIEKNGEVIDQRIVVVEQGKVSPVHINLKETIKHLEFYDPLSPSRNLNEVELSFFDGVISKELDDENRARIKVQGGFDPNYLHLGTEPAASGTFISRNKGLQRVPFISDLKLIHLADKNKFDIKDGLIFGFVQSEEKFITALVENQETKTIYFNASGQEIDPRQEIAYGFIMSGFEQGLSSILVESVEDSAVLASDLVFSDHEAISVVHFEVLP